MSTSTNGQICYGIYFDEGHEFPWDGEEWEGDIENWWLIESGWKWDKQNPFDEHGNYSTGLHEDHPLVNEYFDSRYAWKESHPCPIELVNYQSGECPAHIIALPESIITARRGYPEVINPAYQLNSTKEMTDALTGFCAKYGIEHDTGPQWYLSSYWG